MKNYKAFVALLMMLTVFGCARIISAQTTAFTYQGQLSDGAMIANGTFQMQFALFDAATGGNQIGATITDQNVTVTRGVFTVRLDFSPATPFASGAARFLQVAVKKPAETSYTPLDPRQQITSAPYAIRTLSAQTAQAADGLSANCVACVSNAQIAAVDGSKVTGGGAIANLNASNLTSGTVPLARLGTNTPTATTFLRGDNTFAPIPGGSGVTLQVSATHTAGQTLPVNGNPALNISFANIITAPTAGIGTFDGTTFTATTGGLYLVTGQLGSNSNSAGGANQIPPVSQIAVNGVQTAFGTTLSSFGAIPVSETPGRGVVTAVIALNANDTVVIQAKSGNSTATSNLTTNGLTRLTIAKLN